MPGKIENTLPDAQLTQLLEELRALSGKPTLKQVQAAAKKHGVDISLMGAKTFRDNSFEAHLQRLRRGREMADQILKARIDGSNTLAAVQELAGQELLDAFTAVDAEGRPNLDKVAGILLKLTIADSSRQEAARKQQETEAKLRIAEEQLAKLERARTEWEEKRRQVAEQLARAKNASTEDADAIRANVVETIDDIMGLKKK